MADLSPKRDKFGEALVVEVVQDPHVLAVAEQPVDRGKVLPLSQLLVQSPEHLRTGDRVVVGGRRDQQHSVEETLGECPIVAGDHVDRMC